jgi:hypothetical protein
MTQPTVCALCLTADRQALTDRAVRSFLAQDYVAADLLIYDTGKVPYRLGRDFRDRDIGGAVVVVHDRPAAIGKLRNDALRLLLQSERPVDIICHFDSDDWSAPTRISDQVKLLVESGKDCVGFREMLVWKRSQGEILGAVTMGETHAPGTPSINTRPGEAWLYTNTNPKYAMETSLCYWRSAWEKTPHDECMHRESKTFLRVSDVLGVPAFGCRDDGDIGPGVGRMIAELHGANTSLKINAESNSLNPDGTPYWRRVESWDSRVRQILESA